MAVEPHNHNGLNSPAVNADDLSGPAVVTRTFQISARTVQPSVIQRGSYTLSAGIKFVTFPLAYSTASDLIVTLISKTANQQFLDSTAVSGFTVSGSGSDGGNFIAVGYK